MATQKRKFDYVIGNPPYNASGIINNYGVHRIYYEALGLGGKHGSLAFAMKGVDYLKNNGKLLYIIPTNGMVLKNSIGFRNYISSSSSITYTWVTNKDVFRNKRTNKLEACIQGNTFIIEIIKNKNEDCLVETEYSNGLSFKTKTNYSEYNNQYFPLVLSKLTESAMNKVINKDCIKLSDILNKGAMHNSIKNDVINLDKQEDTDIKVMVKLNRGENIKYGWTSIDEGEYRNLYKVVFSPICKIKEIYQYGKISTAIIPSGTSVQANYSYFRATTQDEANFIQKYLQHPLVIISTAQLFDNAYINNSNLGRLGIPPFENLDDITEYVWNYFDITDDEKKEVESIYNLILMTEKSQMKKHSNEEN